MKSERILPVFVPIAIIAFCVLLAAGVLPANGQQTVTSATLSGRVEDRNGAIVSGSTLTITNLETNQSQTTASDSSGRYKFPYVQVGPYHLSVTANGFATLTKELALS